MIEPRMYVKKCFSDLVVKYGSIFGKDKIMTDKQIIIDVCPYQGECSVSGCKRNDDGCFVRQLFEERYRAENQIVELNKKVEAKEQECENLKKQLMQKSEVDMFFNTPIEGWSSDPCGICKYKNYLIEIKEIIEQGIKIHDDIIVSKQILQKISECETR